MDQLECPEEKREEVQTDISEGRISLIASKDLKIRDLLGKTIITSDVEIIRQPFLTIKL